MKPEIKNSENFVTPFYKTTFFYVLLFISFIGIAFILFTFYIAFYHTSLARQNGTLGDFIGGTLNPILTLLSLTGILISIFIQNRELMQNREEIRRSADALEEQKKSQDLQNFDFSFFQMIDTHNSIINSMDIPQNGREDYKGRDCFTAMYLHLYRNYKHGQFETDDEL